MNNEQILRNPEKCIQCLENITRCEDTLDLFTETYEHMLKTFKEDKPTLRQMRALLMKQVDYLFELRASRTRQGLQRGMNN